MAKYDLTSRIAPDLDRHLLFPLLEFLQERQLYPDEQILKSKIELLNKTNMVDYAVDIHKSLYRTATSLKATGHSHSSRTNDDKSDSYAAGSTSHRCSGHKMHVQSPRSSSLTNFIWQM